MSMSILNNHQTCATLLKLFVTESCTERFLWLWIWGGGAEARWPNALRHGASHIATVWTLTIKAYENQIIEDLPAEKDEENWFRRLGAREALSRVECWKVKVLKFLKKLNLHSWVKLRLRKKRLLPFVGFRHPPETFWVVVIVEAMGDPLPNLPLKLLIIFKQLALLPFLVAEWFLKSHQLLIFSSLVRPLIRHDKIVLCYSIHNIIHLTFMSSISLRFSTWQLKLWTLFWDSLRDVMELKTLN